MSRTKGASLVRTHIALGLESRAQIASAAMHGAVHAHPTLIQTLTNGIAEIADIAQRTARGERLNVTELTEIRGRYIPALKTRPGDPVGGVLHDALSCMLGRTETDSMRALRFAMIRGMGDANATIDYLLGRGIRGDISLLTTIAALEPVQNLLPNGCGYQSLMNGEFHGRPRQRTYATKTGG